MALEIIAMSIISYLILVNGCLTFRLKIFQNIIVTFIIGMNIVLIGNLIGSLFVIPMFIMLIIYIGWLKKEDLLLNIFLLIFCYTVLVIVDNVTHFIWSIMGLKIEEHWIVYMLVDYPIFFILCRFISRKVVNLKNKKGLMLSRKILMILGGNLTLCMIIFVMHITMVEQAGASSKILFSSIILYVTYVILTSFVVTGIVKEYDTNAKIILKQNSYDNLQKYMLDIEELYQNLRTFRHDYVNIMVSMAGYMEANDMAGLKKYYEEQIFPISKQLNKEKDVISRLHNLEIIELKSLLAVKINYALELNIKVNLEITKKINVIQVNCIDLVRVIGVLVDNAIEACQECETPFLNLSIIKMDASVTFIVRNNYVKKDIDYTKLGSIGISSKGEQRGVGLYNIRAIVNDYDNVIMDTEYEEEYFTQVLEIYSTY